MPPVTITECFHSFMFSFHVFLEGQKELPLIAEETEQKQTNRISAKPALFTCQTASFGTHKGTCFCLSFHHPCNLPHTHACTHSPLQNTPSHTHFEELATCACKKPLAGPRTGHTQQTQGHLRDLHALGFVHGSQVLTDSPWAQWKKADASSRQTDRQHCAWPPGKPM